MQVERRPIRVMLVEDHNLVRAGIRAVIDGQSDIQVIAEATEGREAIRLARANCPDVAVVDVAMPGMSGIEVTRDIRRLCPQTQVLILTAHDNEEYFFQTLKAGAVGYVLKKAAASDLIAAIEAASKGEPYLYPSVARLLVSDYLQRAPERETFEPLSDREREVLRLVAGPARARDHRSRRIRSSTSITTASSPRTSRTSRPLRATRLPGCWWRVQTTNGTIRFVKARPRRCRAPARSRPASRYRASTCPPTTAQAGLVGTSPDTTTPASAVPPEAIPASIQGRACVPISRPLPIAAASRSTTRTWPIRSTRISISARQWRYPERTMTARPGSRRPSSTRSTRPRTSTTTSGSRSTRSPATPTSAATTSSSRSSAQTALPTP